MKTTKLSESRKIHIILAGVKAIKKYIVPIVITAVSLFMFTKVLFLGFVPTPSMTPTLKVNSFFIGSRIMNQDTIKKGDIVVFVGDDVEGKYLVKRVAAVGGETITVNEKVFQVPQNCYFMLGDNAEASYDSRYWENPYIPYENIIAKVLLPKG